MRFRCLLVAATLVSTACGDRGGGDVAGPPSSPPPGPVCLPPAEPSCLAAIAELTDYPGVFIGTVAGGGADFYAPENACAVQTGGVWYGLAAEDVVLRLAGLMPGKRYGVRLSTKEDLGFYVTSACPKVQGPVAECLNFTDRTTGNETGAFVAAATEHFLVIDAFETPSSGEFEVSVVPAECTVETAEIDCGSAAPYCVNFTCALCSNSFDCDAAAPVCSRAGECVAGPSACTGDDVNDATASGNDGPSAATFIRAPSADSPTVVERAICSAPPTEQDWYKVSLPAGSFGFTLTWPGAPHDLVLYLLGPEGRIVGVGAGQDPSTRVLRADDLMAGDYYLLVVQSVPNEASASVAYTLTVSVPSCVDDFDCVSPGAPVCGVTGVCGSGPADCEADDSGDEGSGDDGPAAARALVSGVVQTGLICSAPAGEVDWFKIAVADAQGLEVTVSWTGADDLNLVVLDDAGHRMGWASHGNPEHVRLTHLPAGNYLVQLSRNTSTATAAATSTAYSLIANVSAAAPCTENADCDDDFRTQLFRGVCETARGVCASIPAGSRATGAPCDSDDDCASERCSYQLFEADAARSACTVACEGTDECITALGMGFTCTGFAVDNICVPGCTSDLDCGAKLISTAFDANEPWDYWACDAATAVCRP